MRLEQIAFLSFTLSEAVGGERNLNITVTCMLERVRDAPLEVSLFGEEQCRKVVKVLQCRLEPTAFLSITLKETIEEK